MLYVVYLKGKSDATCIRATSYASGFAENGIDTRMVFLIKADPSWEKPTKTKYYYYDCSCHCPRIFKIHKLLSFVWACFHVCSQLQKGDVVFCATPNWLLMRLARMKHIRVYTENTEIPYSKINNTLKNRLVDYLSSKAIKKSNGCFVISQGLMEYYKAEGLPVLSVVNMFVDIRRFSDIDSRRNNTLISYCGTISIFKDGVDILIRAFSHVVKRHPEMKLQIIGDFSSLAVKETIEKLVDDLHLKDKIIFLGRISAAELPLTLSESAILVLSRPDNIQAKYGFPTKVGEYLCTARPVVVTEVGELNLFLQDRVSCIFAQPDNEEDFARQLNWTIEHKEQAAIIGERGRDVALSSFDCIKESRQAAICMGLL